MSSWIDGEESRVRAEEGEVKRRQEREQVLSRLAASIWNELQYAAEEDVKRINKNEAIQQKVRCELKFFGESVSSFRVEKEVYPAIRLYVSLSGGTLYIRRTIAKIRCPDKFPYQDDSVSRSEEKEELKLNMDIDGAPYFQAKGHQIIKLEQLSEYLLKPLLVEPTPTRRHF